MHEWTAADLSQLVSFNPKFFVFFNGFGLVDTS